MAFNDVAIEAHVNVQNAALPLDYAKVIAKMFTHREHTNQRTPIEQRRVFKAPLR